MEFILYMIFMVTIYMFFYYKNYFLMMLMSMEFLVMNLMLLLIMGKFLNFYTLYFLIISVCEAVMGLSLLVTYVRFKGNDKMKLLNLILW